jgi:hypothetical protein
MWLVVSTAEQAWEPDSFYREQFVLRVGINVFKLQVVELSMWNPGSTSEDKVL